MTNPIDEIKDEIRRYERYLSDSKANAAAFKCYGYDAGYRRMQAAANTYDKKLFSLRMELRGFQEQPPYPKPKSTQR